MRVGIFASLFLALDIVFIFKMVTARVVFSELLCFEHMRASFDSVVLFFVAFV